MFRPPLQAVYPFTYQLPAAQKRLNGERRAKRHDVMNHDGKILVAEDDDVTRESLVELFQKWSYEVRGASDGLEALQKISTSIFDLVISDLYMPHMSGFELLKELRQRFPSVGCIIVSGADHEPDESEVMRLGACRFLRKPIDLEQLQSAVSGCLDAQKRNRPRRAAVDRRIWHLVIRRGE
ncbi:MAG: response regulator [Terriglobia bacterium]